MTGLQVGDEVPILLQLADGATDQHPQAEIRDNEANLLTTLNLSHQANGMYVPPRLPLPHPYKMPDEVFIKAIYIVYSDAGHLTENTLYEKCIDIFSKITPDDYKRGTDGAYTGTPPTVEEIRTEMDTNSIITANILRVLGLSQENYYLDQTTYITYEDMKLLTSGRMRTYSDAVSVGTDINILATYLITATWTGDEMSTYKVTKV